MKITRAFACGVAVSLAGTWLYSKRATSYERLHPELRSPWLRFRTPSFTDWLVKLSRRLPTNATTPDEITVASYTVRGQVGATDVMVFVYNPRPTPEPTPALFFIHGGGYIGGNAAMSHDACVRFARELDIVVVNVEYRLAPETPFPGPLDDCYTALVWTKQNAAMLGIDPDRIAIAGESAGGGLAAALVQLAHDRGEIAPVFQLLYYPMLDDRTVLLTDHAGRGEFIWTPGSNRLGWTSYLGHAPRPDDAPEYAAPARRTDLAGLPPAWIGVGTLDLFYPEDKDYARRLEAAGVPCEFDEVEGAYHASESFNESAPVSQAFRARSMDALRHGLGLSRS